MITGPQHEGHGHPEERPRIRTKEEVPPRDEGGRPRTGKFHYPAIIYFRGRVHMMSTAHMAEWGGLA